MATITMTLMSEWQARKNKKDQEGKWMRCVWERKEEGKRMGNKWSRNVTHDIYFL